ncbi:MAG: phosphoribosyl-AMP cyclohydrolase [Ruminococcaceae bacterium]|nr:phosphoribosyl-AMP cyclohydrolase [Oscillospiraceae bacterium]
MNVEIPETYKDSELKYAVILAKYNGKYVFVKHRERETLEIPGGHREPGENIAETAARELYEETGAVKYSLRQICPYKVNDLGMLFYAEITEFGELPQSEIEKVFLLDELPKELSQWTYPEIQPFLREKIESEISNMDLKKHFKKSELIPAIIQDAENGEVLMLAYMNEESLAKTLETGYTWFWSRSRQELWNKGATSGHFQKVIEIYGDCDDDTLLIKVEQTGAACHTGNRTCFFNRIK